MKIKKMTEKEKYKICYDGKNPSLKKRHYLNLFVRGKRSRKYFLTEKDAITFAKKRESQIKKYGQIAQVLPPDDVQDYLTCKEMIPPRFKSLKDWITALSSYPTPPNISATSGKCPLELAYEKFVAEYEYKMEKGKNEETTKKMLACVKRFIGHFKNQVVTVDKALDYFRNKAAPNKHPFINARTFFNLAEKRDWLDYNPMHKIEITDLHLKQNYSVDIFAVDQARQFLENLKKHPRYCQYIPFFAIQMFGAIRPEEAEQLKAEHFDFKRKQIYIPIEIAKNKEGAGTMENLPQNLWSILNNHKKNMYHAPRSNNLRKSLHEQTTWGHDICRYSAATYYYYLNNRDMKEAMRLTRHTQQETFKTHYLNVKPIDKETAEAYFSIIV